MSNTTPGDSASSSAEADRSGGGSGEPHHFRRMVMVWAPLAVVADVLFYFLAGPHIPPGKMTSSAGGAQLDFNVLFVIALPVILGVWIFMGYSIWSWRASRLPGDPEVGPNSHGNFKVQFGWIAGTTTIVLGLFVFGTVQLIEPAGAGGGPGG